MLVSDIISPKISSRNAVKIVQEANKFKASVWISYNDRHANAKSLLGILSLGIEAGNKIKVIADSDDEKEEYKSLEAISNLIENNFEEEN
jgi:phosphocarrier protein